MPLTGTCTRQFLAEIENAAKMSGDVPAAAPSFSDAGSAAAAGCFLLRAAMIWPNLFLGIGSPGTCLESFR